MEADDGYVKLTRAADFFDECVTTTVKRAHRLGIPLFGDGRSRKLTLADFARMKAEVHRHHRGANGSEARP